MYLAVYPNTKLISPSYSPVAMFVKIKNCKQIQRVIIAEYDVSNALKWKNQGFYTHPVLVRAGTGKEYFVEMMQRNNFALTLSNTVEIRSFWLTIPRALIVTLF
jgi:hypothetical protein